MDKSAPKPVVDLLALPPLLALRRVPPARPACRLGTYPDKAVRVRFRGSSAARVRTTGSRWRQQR